MKITFISDGKQLCLPFKKTFRDGLAASSRRTANSIQNPLALQKIMAFSGVQHASKHVLSLSNGGLYERVTAQILLSCCLLLFLPTHTAYESITQFHTDLTLTTAGTAHVVEEVTYNFPPFSHPHGFLRLIQTRYQGPFGTRFFIPLTIDKVLRDGKPESYELVSTRRGVLIKTGSREQFLTPGIHQFTISYTMENVIRFLDKSDELYWQVTGTSWRIPIEQVSITIHLPTSITTDTSQCWRYTGRPDASISAQECTASTDGSISFRAPAEIQPGEGFSIVLPFAPQSFPRPSFAQKLGRFFHDNGSLLLLILGLITAFSYLIVRWRKIRAAQYKGTVIPLFYPPADLLPTETGYIIQMGFNNRQFAAELVNMAITGFITIELVPSSWGWSKEYLLNKTEKDRSTAPLLHQQLLDILFPGATATLRLNKNATYDRELMRTALKTTAKIMRQTYNKKMFTFDAQGLWITVSTALISSASAYLASIVTTPGGFVLGDDPLFIVLTIMMAPLIFFAFYLFYIYTQEGCKTRDAINGFRLFLTTTETARLEIIGTPPTKTPQLFEKYLPYAIALNAEKAWTAQFASVFADLEKSGTPYLPLWIGGGAYNSLGSSLDQLAHFTSDLDRLVADTTAFSSASSSGSGGKGSSGGGFGGGGGGSW